MGRRGRGLPRRAPRLPRRELSRRRFGTGATSSAVRTSSRRGLAIGRPCSSTAAGWCRPTHPSSVAETPSPVQTLIFLEELASRGIMRSLHFGGYAIVGPSLLEFGNDAQKALAPAAIRGDTVWCVGMSEPNAGSDLAALTTRAVLDGDSFVVNGQKVWTSYAAIAQKCFCYVRTDPTVPKHKGISVLDHRHGHAGRWRSDRSSRSEVHPSSPRCSSPTPWCRRRT